MFKLSIDPSLPMVPVSPGFPSWPCYISATS